MRVETRFPGGRSEGQMDNERLARWWATFAGVALLGAGLLGFVGGNPIASASPTALFQVNALHNIIHIATGVLALWLAFGTRGYSLATGLIGYGALYAVVAVLLVVDPKLFGLFADAPANVLDHVLHAALAIVSLGLGWMLRSAGPTQQVAR
jgi:hypothetical protein